MYHSDLLDAEINVVNAGGVAIHRKRGWYTADEQPDRYAPFDIKTIGLERFLQHPESVIPVPCGVVNCHDLMLVQAGYDLARVRCERHRQTLQA
jgi:hypothetical protein